MTLRLNVIAQLAGASCQLLIDTLPVAHDWHPWLRGLAAFVQLYAGVMAQYRNPDGTPAEVAYAKRHRKPRIDPGE